MTLSLYNDSSKGCTCDEEDDFLDFHCLGKEQLATNVFYPVSFSEVTLPTAKITITDINQDTSTSATVRDTTTLLG